MRYCDLESGCCRFTQTFLRVAQNETDFLLVLNSNKSACRLRCASWTDINLGVALWRRVQIGGCGGSISGADKGEEEKETLTRPDAAFFRNLINDIRADAGS